MLTVTRCQNNIFYLMMYVHLKLIRAFILILSIDIVDDNNNNNNSNNSNNSNNKNNNNKEL